MSKIYFFSKSKFELLHNNINYTINEFKSISMLNVVEYDLITLTQNCSGYLKTINLFPQTIKGNNFFDIYNFNRNRFVNLISLDYENLISEINTNSFNIKIYSSSILIINKQICLSYYFKSSKNNYAFEIGEKLYIFNEFNLIQINTKSYISTMLITKKLETNSNNLEILCKIPKSNKYFVLFTFDLNDNTISIKKLMNNATIDNISLPYLVFYLCKLEFEEVSIFLSDKINIEDLKNYLNNFNEMVEIENKFFIYSKNKFETINFNIENNIITDID